MRKTMAALALMLCVPLLVAACGGSDELTLAEKEELYSEHMAAQATLAAHYIAAALDAGMGAEEINAVLVQIAQDTVIGEFWISDETGAVVFTSRPGTDFQFPTDLGAGTQAAPFAALLQGSERVVTQNTLPRELDLQPFKYVAAAGVDQPRIVQVGVSGAALSGE